MKLLEKKKEQGYLAETRVEMKKEVWLKKACEWLRFNACHYMFERKYHFPFHTEIELDEKSLVENFKNYMKGE